MKVNKINIVWFRRDLRIADNLALYHALEAGLPVLPIFIFDTHITGELPANDARINFIYDTLSTLNNALDQLGSGILIKKGKPAEVFSQLINEFQVNSVYTNRDYESYAIKRDALVSSQLEKKGVSFYTFKDQVIFEPGEVLKPDGNPYTVFTPFKKAWLNKLGQSEIKSWIFSTESNFHSARFDFPSIAELGFEKSKISVKPFDLSIIPRYHEYRDIPGNDATSRIGPHLRFGTISIRNIVKKLNNNRPGESTFLSELIWREFFVQILFYFPRVVNENFKMKYNGIWWLNNEQDFQRWKEGLTGYPIVDAGMRQLKQTGFMHNRVRMITAGFLCKHLLIDWKWGEAYFASQLLDYELASNNGNWQWAAGTGCDAAPYFRIFNPTEQIRKFDPDFKYIKQWLPEFDKLSYPDPIIEHKLARARALETYKKGIIS